MIVSQVTLRRLSLPLKVPYKLAFGAVTAFDTILVTIQGDGGEHGVGEATILTGYTAETIDSAWAKVKELAVLIKGRDADAAKDLALTHLKKAPFAVSSVVTAVEMAEGSPFLDISRDTPVPLLAILSASDDAGIAAELDRHRQAGYGTVKVKVGFEWESDARRLKFIQGEVGRMPAGTLKLRIDGNQGFSRADALAFTRILEPDHIELFEQPCHMDDWDAAKAVSDISSVPMMLDESIYGPAEIERAAESGSARFVKLKLMKAGSLSALAEQLTRIRELGMEPVLGNGVAADPGCWMEACIARTHISNAGEMNGFLKPHRTLFADPIRVERGSMILTPGAPALIDDAALDALAAETVRVAA
ncbi:enolase C-terminal domain-like protein [Thalassospiraceae bacterium LMO-SO8]|nr:mandelate racemase [Alphaproteobacteria bacterium LMO-S08]WND76876.1 enolase C-terminal domain-like protein [Thalassospiraceae bacterium LMO-SO8]